MTQSCKPKNCKVCSMEFQPISRNQMRCQTCIVNNVHSLTPPLCKCGCGTPLIYNRGRKGYGEYSWGHRLKHDLEINRQETIDSMSHANPRKGNITYYEHNCDMCSAFFRNQFKEAKYCSQNCYHAEYRGEKHPFYKHGKGRTKYKYYTENGVLKRVHRRVMEGMIGRPLRFAEEVHHIDEDGLNNEPNNLHLFHCRGCHMFHHSRKAPLQYEYTEAHEIPSN